MGDQNKTDLQHLAQSHSALLTFAQRVFDLYRGRTGGTLANLMELTYNLHSGSPENIGDIIGNAEWVQRRIKPQELEDQEKTSGVCKWCICDNPENRDCCYEDSCSQWLPSEDSRKPIGFCHRAKEQMTVWQTGREDNLTTGLICDKGKYPETCRNFDCPDSVDFAKYQRGMRKDLPPPPSCNADTVRQAIDAMVAIVGEGHGIKALGIELMDERTNEPLH